MFVCVCCDHGATLDRPCAHDAARHPACVVSRAPLGRDALRLQHPRGQDTHVAPARRGTAPRTRPHPAPRTSHPAPHDPCRLLVALHALHLHRIHPSPDVVAHGSYEDIFLSSGRVDSSGGAVAASPGSPRRQWAARSALRFEARVIAFCVWHVPGVGYTMTDILYVWKDGASSVGMSSEVQLPQFRVLGHRQRATVITLSTGNRSVVASPAPPRPRPHPRDTTAGPRAIRPTRDRVELPRALYLFAPQSATPCGISGTNGTRGPTRWASLTKFRSRSSRCWAIANVPWRYLLQQVRTTSISLLK